jgi:hypothetical protein
VAGGLFEVRTSSPASLLVGMRCSLVVSTALALGLAESRSANGMSTSAFSGSSLESSPADLLKGSSPQQTTLRRRLGQNDDKEFPDAGSPSEASTGNSLEALLDQYSPESVTPHPAATTATTSQYELLPPAPTPTFYDGSSYRRESDDLSKEEATSDERANGAPSQAPSRGAPGSGLANGEDTSSGDDDDDDDDDDKSSTSGSTAPAQFSGSQPAANSSSVVTSTTPAANSSSTDVLPGEHS